MASCPFDSVVNILLSYSTLCQLLSNLIGGRSRKRRKDEAAVPFLDVQVLDAVESEGNLVG